MLATAHMFASDAINETLSFAEVGGFVFQPDGFHKVFANANGTYAETELFADSPPHDTTGLTRVHSVDADPLVTTTAGAPLKMEGAPVNPAALGPTVAWTVTHEVERERERVCVCVCVCVSLSLSVFARLLALDVAAENTTAP